LYSLYFAGFVVLATQVDQSDCGHGTEGVSMTKLGSSHSF